MSRRTREAAFFDAATVAPGADGPDRFVADLLAQLPSGSLEGLRLLDLGCGSGALTRRLTRRGARVVGLDVSEAALALAPAGPLASYVRAGAEQLPFAADSFDLVVGSLVLHHLPIESSARELRRVLRPGGRAVFSENFGLNPVLRWARKLLPGRFGIARLGTPDEKPLDRGDLERLARHFQVRLSFPDFLFFHLLDRQLFRYRKPAVNRACIRLDRWIHRGFPGLRRYGYRGTLILEPVAQRPRSARNRR